MGRRAPERDIAIGSKTRGVWTGLPDIAGSWHRGNRGTQAICRKMTPIAPRRMFAALPGGKKSDSFATNSNRKRITTRIARSRYYTAKWRVRHSYRLPEDDPAQAACFGTI